MNLYPDQSKFAADTSSSFLDDRNTLPLLDNGKQNEHTGPIADEMVVINGTWQSDWPNERLEPNYLQLSRSGDSQDSSLWDSYSEITIEDNVLLNGYHCHTQQPFKSNCTIYKQLIAASVICFVFMIVEIVGGYVAGSLAVMTDASHLFSDFIGFLVSLLSISISSNSANKRYNFGYHRAELLGAMFNVIVIWVLSLFFIYLAVLRVVHSDFQIKVDTMMAVAIFGICVNIVMGIILQGMCNLSHGHTHSNKRNHAKNINLRAAVIHVFGDLIQSVGVLIAAIIIKQNPSAKIADPICTCLFSVIVLFTTRGICKDSMEVLMEAFPRTFNYNLIHTSIKSISGVKNVHNLQVWSLSVDVKALSVHVAVDEALDKNDILKRVTLLLRRKFNIHHTTVQVETFDAQMVNCVQCTVAIAGT